MEQIQELFPGIRLRCLAGSRFKQSCLTVQAVTRADAETTPVKTLIPAILLRGSAKYPDLRAIARKLDSLYGTSAGALVRKVGDYQTVGLYFSFIDDRYAMPGDRLLAAVVSFLEELMLNPLLENGVFKKEIVESEKKNLLAAIDSARNDKRSYASFRLLQEVCRGDAFGISRLGNREDAEKITAEGTWELYQKILREAPVEIIYVGGEQPRQVAELLRPVFARLQRDCRPVPEQTVFVPGKPGSWEETMEVAQARLCMAFSTPITQRDEDFAAMQVANAVFGTSMTSKLFMNVREKMSLCYDIGSSYFSTKGLLEVSAGIAPGDREAAETEILRQLEECQKGHITEEELEAAREAFLSGLRTVTDSAGAMEHYYSGGILGGRIRSIAQYKKEIRAVTAEDAARAARTLTPCGVYFLKGGDSCGKTGV